MDQIIMSKHARSALQVGFKNHWRFRILGQGEVPAEPVYRGEWWFSPASKVPQAALGRVRALKRSNIPIKGYVLAHEAPKALQAPKIETSPVTPPSQQSTAAANFLLEGLLLMVGVIFQAMLVDPAFIVVLEDGTWLEVCTWYE